MIQSVDRAARILTALSQGNGRLGVSELSERLALAKGTVHGLLRTLQVHGLVEQDPETEKYQLGPALLTFSNSYLGINQLRSHALAWSELLVERTQETARVAAPYRDGVVIVHHVFRPDTSLQVLDVGGILPLHATALGKAVLAYLRPDELNLVLPKGTLPKLTAYTHTTRSALRRDLDAVHATRYAIERQEAVLGEAGIASPIFDRRRVVCGAIGITGPQDRLLRPNEIPSLARAVIDAARGVSRDLGAPSWPIQQQPS